MQSSTSNDTIVPTFTMNTQSSDVKWSKNMCMYDQASQTTFISQATTQHLNCDVATDNIKISISGFKESKVYHNSIFMVTTNVNNKLRKYNAIVVPEIKTKMKSKYLPIIVNKLKN